MFGLIESGYSEYDYNFNDILGIGRDDQVKSDFPLKYNCMDYCDLKVEDQGRTMQCVAYSLAKVLEYNHETLKDPNNHFDVDKKEIYDSRSNKDTDNGMTIRDALHFVKHNKYHIKLYGRVQGRGAIMKSLFVNGPCIMALPVYDSSRTDFWNGSHYEGGHAVCCVGYNDEGFIILNSWGETYGDFGTTVLPYDELGKLLECWVVVA